MQILESNFIKNFIKMASDGNKMGWHECNGGNLSYRIKDEEILPIKKYFNKNSKWIEIGSCVPKLANEFFLVTGSGKYFSNIESDPKTNIGIIEIDDTGKNYRILWGLIDNGKPTSELPTHLMNHEIKKEAANGLHRIIYHAHTTNIIALTFVLPLKDEVFTRQLWEMITECAVIFPQGVGVVPWMIPGGHEIAEATSVLMKKYNIVIWAHHGTFVSGENFDKTFGLMHTVEKTAEILIKVMSIGGKKQTISNSNIRDLAAAFNLNIKEELLNVSS